MILLYAVNMYSSHKEVSLATSIAKQNKAREENQNENKERRRVKSEREMTQSRHPRSKMSAHQ